MVPCGGTSVHKVGEREAGIEIEGGGSEDLDAPVYVCRVAVLKIIIGDKVSARIERLMAHDHTAPETVCRKDFWRSQATMTKEATFGIQDIGISIDHSGQARDIDLLEDLRERITGVKGIARVHEAKVITRSKGYAFVHRIIDPSVGFREHDRKKIRIS